MKMKITDVRYLRGMATGLLTKTVNTIDPRFMGLSAGIIAAVQLPFYLLTLVGLTDKVEDLSYAMTFAAVALGTLFFNGTFFLRQMILTSLVVIWGLRLGLFLYYRAYFMRDYRMEPFKRSAAGLTQFYAMQCAAIWLNILPVTFLNSFNRNIPLNMRDMIGFSMWAAGFAIESIADYQKFTYKNKHKNHWCDVGLWRYSRHPNFFGECLMWFGIFVSVSHLLRGWENMAILGPIYITSALLMLTGIPPVERKQDEQFGKRPEYQRYKQETSAFIPMPTRRQSLKMLHLAREKGSETLDTTVHKGQEIYQQGAQKSRELYEQGSQKGRELYEQGSQKGRELYEKGKQQVGEKFERARQLAEDNKERAKDETENATANIQQKGQEYAVRGRQKVDELGQRAEPYVDEAMHRGAEFLEEHRPRHRQHAKAH